MFPLRLQIETSTGPLGWLLIGPRPDGSIAGKDEQEALKKIASTLARSVCIVLTGEEDKRQLMRALDSHDRRIDRMERYLKIQP